jgi:creatinine amidohydrolase/Fe(II)-dependent formamide hydrolase-like protein
MEAASQYRYARLTWEEMNDALAAQKVVVLPTGSTEQHGPHLPLDVDVFLAESVCLELGRRASDRVLVLPPVSYGLNRHHIDFPVHAFQRLLGTLDQGRRSWRSHRRHGGEGEDPLGGRAVRSDRIGRRVARLADRSTP